VIGKEYTVGSKGSFEIRCFGGGGSLAILFDYHCL